jgi:NAD(P)-dependent dehydrogenase (short-subunit alcohol dehydrogenase family)
MAGKLTGKVAVVTGAGSQRGIGKETAKAMAAEDAKLVVNDFGKDPDGTMGADRVVNEIKEAGGTAVANYDSVASMIGGQNIIQTAIDNFGRIDILVNTAGNFISAPTVEMKEEQWDAIIAVHLKGLFACTQAALKHMIPQKSGRIINFTSIAAYSPDLGPSPAVAYCAAKGGVMGFTRVLSWEMLPYGITVNSIQPVASTMLFNMGPMGPKPEFVASVVAYLATDESQKITGQIIGVNAGNITVYAPPMGDGGAHRSAHKAGMWTMDELIQVMPIVAGIPVPRPGPGGPPPAGGPPPNR